MSWRPCPPSCHWTTLLPTRTRRPTRRCRILLSGRQSTHPSSGWAPHLTGRCGCLSRWACCWGIGPPTAPPCCCCTPVCHCLPSCWNWMSRSTPPRSSICTNRCRVFAPMKINLRTHSGWLNSVCRRRAFTPTSIHRCKLSLLFLIRCLFRVSAHCWLTLLTSTHPENQLWLHWR